MYIVTGLTKMRNGVCMSVYDTKCNRYLRPKPPTYPFSTGDVEDLSLFSVVRMTPNHDVQEQIIPPHTEDFPILEQRLVSKRVLTPAEQLQLLRQISESSVHDVFGMADDGKPALRQVRNSWVIHPGCGTRSLGTVKVRWYHSRVDGYNKTRIDFIDDSGGVYRNISYVAFREQIPKYFPGAEMYIRLSLSRKYRPGNWDSEECFLQVSSIHLYL